MELKHATFSRLEDENSRESHEMLFSKTIFRAKVCPLFYFPFFFF